MRTNIEIDDELMRQALRASGATTKKDAVDAALRLMVQINGQGQALEQLWGNVVWRGHEDDWLASEEATQARPNRETEQTVGRN